MIRGPIVGCDKQRAGTPNQRQGVPALRLVTQDRDTNGSNVSDGKQALFFGKVNWYNSYHESTQQIISRLKDRVYSFRCAAFAVACDGAQDHQYERCVAGTY